MEINALTDSLTKGIDSPGEKTTRIHEFIVRNIRYSHVSFRQSGWVPQSSKEVLATRIGDCKDMSSLGKAMAERADIPAYLVLVNTREHNYIDHAYVGPDFNHCILAVELEGKLCYMDLTEANLPYYRLPKKDQGAMALIIKPGNKSLITLPVDQPKDRIGKRTLKSTIDTNGAIVQKVSGIRVGISAGGRRDSYRFKSYEEQEKVIHEAIEDYYPDVTIDTLSFRYLDTLCDTVGFSYTYKSKNGVTFSGNTAIMPVHIPDNISNSNVPREDKRVYPLDLYRVWYNIGTFHMNGEINYPANWRPLSLPSPVKLKTEYGNYSYDFRRKGNKIVYKRVMELNITDSIELKEYAKVRKFLASIAKADAVQLVFKTP
jgi:hypothetical protein